MKKLSIFVILIAYFMMPIKYMKNSFSMVEKKSYAKVLAGCIFYKSQQMDNSFDDIYFVLPESYFVLVLDEVSDNVLMVQYKNYVGYVNKLKVLMATFTPVVKFLDNITLSIKKTSGTQIWSSPSTSRSDVLTTIQAGTSNINYIAMTYGEIPSGGETNIWYYISYTSSINSTNVYEGYVYSENTTNLSEIVFNLEVNPEVINENNSSKNLFNISSGFQTVVIAIITIPIIVFFAIILYKLIKNIQNNANKHKNLNLNKSENLQENTATYANQNHHMNKSFLRQDIDHFKSTSFVKKNSMKHNNDDCIYPDFPTYTSEDDLL